MFANVRRGLDLTRKAGSVIRTSPGLARFPLIGGVLALIALVVLGTPGAVLLDKGDTPGVVGGIALLAVGAYLASFALTFYNAALTAAADQAMRGEKPDRGAARGVASHRIRSIAAWALLAGGIRLLFAVLKGRGGKASRMGAAMGADIWSMVTFLVVPVPTFQGLGPIAATKQSATLFRQRWAQQFTGTFVVGGFAGFAVLIGLIIALVGAVWLVEDDGDATLAGAALLVLGVVVCIAAAVYRGATRGVFGVALYRYGVDDRPLPPFTAVDLELNTPGP